MPKSVPELKALQLKSLGPGMHRVGGVPGLNLHVGDSGSQSWILRTVVGTRRREIGLGGYPAVGLAEARETARKLREQVREGLDPVAERRRKIEELKAAQMNTRTFEQCAREFIADQQHGWRNIKHRKQWLATLETYAFPLIGKMGVAEVSTDHVRAILRQQCKGKKNGPFWNCKPETASRVRGRMERILDWAAYSGLRQGINPARWQNHLKAAMPSAKSIKVVQHRPYVPVNEVPDFYGRLLVQGGLAAKALQLLILTATRSGEVRGARWSEFDLGRRVWIVPAERMKAGVEHRIPLSDEALKLIKNLPKAEGTDLLFPSSRLTALSDMTLTAVMRRMGASAVPHGFRTSFRIWAGEAGYAFDYCEAALAHKHKSKVVEAYYLDGIGVPLNGGLRIINACAGLCNQCTLLDHRATIKVLDLKFKRDSNVSARSLAPRRHVDCPLKVMDPEQIQHWRHLSRLANDAEVVLAEAELARYKGYGPVPSDRLKALATGLRRLSDDLHARLMGMQ